jgi:hypothetical protein
MAPPLIHDLHEKLPDSIAMGLFSAVVLMAAWGLLWLWTAGHDHAR